jgi:hypothetical protein
MLIQFKACTITFAGAALPNIPRKLFEEALQASRDDPALSNSNYLNTQEPLAEVCVPMLLYFASGIVLFCIQKG